MKHVIKYYLIKHVIKKKDKNKQTKKQKKKQGEEAGPLAPKPFSSSFHMLQNHYCIAFKCSKKPFVQITLGSKTSKKK